jgi:CDP-glycerol glycerophosphotransferase (TagB/SpsB family)
VANPLLSIILVVYREQAYLGDCVSSVLDQSFRDVEFVAVDNSSPDQGPGILDELAEQDDRLVVHHLDRVVRLGEALNLALDSATGDYAWFVATTDQLPAGALAAVAARLDVTAPDVLVVDQTRAVPPGAAKPGPHGRLLEAAPDGTFTLEEHPAAMEFGVDVRDNVFRRAFLRALGLRFAAGGYGELTVTYPALLAAERISVLPRVCYARYDPPNAANEPHVHGTRFDVFGQYDVVFQFVASQGARLASRPRGLALQMLRHYLAIAPDLPQPRRKDFLARAYESFRVHAGADEPIPKDWLLLLRARLAQRGRERSLRAHAWAIEQGRAARRGLRVRRRLRGGLARVLRRKGLQPYYRRQLRAPIEQDLAVFAAYWFRGYACNPRAIYEQLRELAPWVRSVWIVDRDHAGGMPPDVEYVVSGTRDYYRAIARAKYFVNNVNFPNDLVKRKGTIHVQTHHGTPLKKMGLDLRDALVAGQRMNFERLLRRAARWDYSISSNAFSTLIWERAYPTRYETLEVGYPRNDALVNATEADIDRIRTQLGIGAGQTAVLYAPTHREYLGHYVPTIDVARVAEELGSDYVLMERLHYFYESDRDRADLRRAGRILDVAGHPSIEELCLAADVLVTDYSALMFDYAVLDRPIVIHAPDWEVYRRLRGTYFDLLAEPPGVVTQADGELVETLRSGAAWGEEAARLRAAFRARFCALDDGHAAERVVRRVWLRESEAAESSSETVERPRRRTVEA